MNGQTPLLPDSDSAAVSEHRRQENESPKNKVTRTKKQKQVIVTTSRKNLPQIITTTATTSRRTAVKSTTRRMPPRRTIRNNHDNSGTSSGRRRLLPPPTMSCKNIRLFVPFVISCGYVLFICIRLHSKHSTVRSSWRDYDSFLPTALVGSSGSASNSRTRRHHQRQQRHNIPMSSWRRKINKNAVENNYKVNEYNTNVVRQLPTMPTTKRRKKRIKLKLPKPIINVGFPKSGTSSIFEFFRCNELIVQHWFCCERQNHHAIVQQYYLMSTCILRNLSTNQPILHNCGNIYKKEDLNEDSNSRSRNRINKDGGSGGTGTYGSNDYVNDDDDSFVDVYSEINGPRRLYKQGDIKGELLDDGYLAGVVVNANDTDGASNKNDVKFDTLSPRILFPQHHYIDKIHEQYPNATFILHTRPTIDWVKSVMSWNDVLKYELTNEFYIQYMKLDKEHSKATIGSTTSHNDTNLDDWWWHHNSNTTKHDGRNNTTTIAKTRRPQTAEELSSFLYWLYNYHTKFIQNFVKLHPSHTLIEIDITNNDTGTILANSFGLDSNCWKQMNKGKSSRTGTDKVTNMNTINSVDASSDSGSITVETKENKKTQQQSSNHPFQPNRSQDVVHQLLSTTRHQPQQRGGGKVPSLPILSPLNSYYGNHHQDYDVQLGGVSSSSSSLLPHSEHRRRGDKNPTIVGSDSDAYDIRNTKRLAQGDDDGGVNNKWKRKGAMVNEQRREESNKNASDAITPPPPPTTTTTNYSVVATTTNISLMTTSTSIATITRTKVATKGNETTKSSSMNATPAAAADDDIVDARSMTAMIRSTNHTTTISMTTINGTVQN